MNNSQDVDTLLGSSICIQYGRCVYTPPLFINLNINPERKTKMSKPTTLPFFDEAVEWCECPFLFNRKFTPEEKNKILEKVRERAVGILEMKRSIVQNLVYDTIEEMGYTTSDM